MSGFLLDTNILSELRKGVRCDAEVRRWIEATPAEAMFVSVVVLAEIRRGVERLRLRDPKQARALEQWLRDIPKSFADRVLTVDERVADQWGFLGLHQPVPTLDAFLAATALVHDLTVVTRNVDDYQNTPARVLNPFSQALPG